MNLVVSENSNLASSHKLVHVDQSAQPVVSTYPSQRPEGRQKLNWASGLALPVDTRPVGAENVIRVA